MKKVDKLPFNRLLLILSFIFAICLLASKTGYAVNIDWSTGFRFYPADAGHDLRNNQSREL